MPFLYDDTSENFSIRSLLSVKSLREGDLVGLFGADDDACSYILVAFGVKPGSSLNFGDLGGLPPFEEK